MLSTLFLKIVFSAKVIHRFAVGGGQKIGNWRAKNQKYALCQPGSDLSKKYFAFFNVF
jgi:hypothetical protein